MKKYAYEVTLTRDEELTLLWLRDHGYDAGFYENSASIIPDETDENVTYSFCESDAWEVYFRHEADLHAFLSCSANDTLNVKLIEFIGSIV